MARKFYVTTAIDYSNGEPHIGHAFEKIGADCIARYRRLRGDQVHFVIGMDENAQNVVQAAEAAATDPRSWVDGIAEKFRAAWAELGISCDDFFRTTEPRHHRSVQELLGRIQRAGHIYEGTYEGYYCVGCESFKQEKDLVNGQCPLHPARQIQWLKEPNFFFRLSSFAPRLLELYERNSEFVRPRAKLNEIRNVVTGGLQDLSVSRARQPWGIPWPGEPGQTVYVWFDALINYLSATGFPDPGFEKLWPADLHIVGPDIVRFHAAIWPAMLMAAGLEVPGGVWSHGWVNWSGARFSKTAGVRVTLREAIDRHGPDPLRYFLLREVPWDGDGNFSWERFDARYTDELADGYGNLASRVLAMITRYTGGIVPDDGTDTALDKEGVERIAGYRAAMDQHQLHLGAQELWALITRANVFVEETAPWNLHKAGNAPALAQALAALARAVARVTLLIQPYIPVKSEVVWRGLGLARSAAEAGWAALEKPPTAGSRVSKLAPLFPKPQAGAVSD